MRSAELVHKIRTFCGKEQRSGQTMDVCSIKWIISRLGFVGCHLVPGFLDRALATVSLLWNTVQCRSRNRCGMCLQRPPLVAVGRFLQCDVYRSTDYTKCGRLLDITWLRSSCNAIRGFSAGNESRFTEMGYRSTTGLGRRLCRHSHPLHVTSCAGR